MKKTTSEAEYPSKPGAIQSSGLKKKNSRNLKAIFFTSTCMGAPYENICKIAVDNVFDLHPIWS